jgi:tetratricopeptide (TPR) repeat protein
LNEKRCRDQHGNVTNALQKNEIYVTSSQAYASNFAFEEIAMRTAARVSLLLLTCLSAPLHSLAQPQPSSNIVSVRELSIPPKAMHAFQQGSLLLAKGDPSGSLPHLQRAISEFAGYYEAYYKLGLAYLKLWHIPEAEQAYRKSIELSGGKYAQPLFGLSAILNDQEKFAEAESVARKGLNLEPDSWRGNYYLGLALFGLGRFEGAESSALESVRARLDFAEAHLLLAHIHGGQKNYRALLNDLDEYLKLDPDGKASAGARALREKVQRALDEAESASALVQPMP